MSSRSALRRKVVLAVIVIRHQGQERQLAHTLDLTATSARLGGLASLLEPGEIIEVQRGGVKARFEVVWMGAPGSAMAGQAGVRGLDRNKAIWNVDLPEDEIDVTVDASHLRQPMPAVHTSTQFPGERRWHPRYTCNGSAAVKTAGSVFATNGEVKDISKGGVYIELSATLPVNSNVTLDVRVEDICFQAAGIVRTSYPLLGMGICLQSLTPENAEKLAIALERARRRSAAKQEAPSQPGHSSTGPGIVFSSGLKSSLLDLTLEDNPGPELVKACRKLAEGFDQWKLSCTPAEIDEVKLAINQLQEKLSPTPENGFIELLPTPIQGSKTI
jgi:hypothetical protein